jgi:hypothetical protein
LAVDACLTCLPNEVNGLMIYTPLTTSLGICNSPCPQSAMNPAVAMEMSRSASRLEEKTSVYPNPIANGLLTVRLPFYTGGVSVFNALGQKVLAYALADEQLVFQLDVTALPLGIYFLKDDQHLTTVKFVKQ